MSSTLASAVMALAVVLLGAQTGLAREEGRRALRQQAIGGMNGFLGPSQQPIPNQPSMAELLAPNLTDWVPPCGPARELLLTDMLTNATQSALVPMLNATQLNSATLNGTAVPLTVYVLEQVQQLLLPVDHGNYTQQGVLFMAVGPANATLCSAGSSSSSSSQEEQSCLPARLVTVGVNDTSLYVEFTIPANATTDTLEANLLGGATALGVLTVDMPRAMDGTAYDTELLLTIGAPRSDTVCSDGLPEEVYRLEESSEEEATSTDGVA